MKENIMEKEKDVIESLYRLMRNFKRRPREDRHAPRSYMKLLYSLENNNDQSASELAETLDIRPSSLSQLLDSMERDQVIVRVKDPDDMRITRISIEDEGKKILEKHEEVKKEEEEKLAAWLTDEEKDDFIRIANKLSQKLEEESQDEGCRNGKGKRGKMHKSHGNRGRSGCHGHRCHDKHDNDTFD